MEKQVMKLPVKPALQRLTRVAAYARVSFRKDAMLHSLAAQVSYYSDLIQKHPGWRYAGVYADEAMTGTKDNREEFQRLLADCRAGKIDMVITKSVSRFARNTVTSLETVRELKAIGVDVYFEEQKIHSMSGDGELMLTILSAFAQEESRSASDNQKWRIRKAFENGELMNMRTMFGYRITRKNGIEIDPEQAAVVREMYARIIRGDSLTSIIRWLNRNGHLGAFGGKWTAGQLRAALSNEKYMGHSLLQKKYRINHIDKTLVPNQGELPQYYATETHPAIIDEATFEAAQQALERIEAQKPASKPWEHHIFTSMIICSACGKPYRHVKNHGKSRWACPTYIMEGKAFCESKQVPEEIIMRMACDLLGWNNFDEEAFRQAVDHVTAVYPHTLIFHLRDGREEKLEWQNRSRSESWTPEMREKAREAARRKNDGKNSDRIPQTRNLFTTAPIATTARRKVAGYARVSTDSDEQFTSYEAQVDYYTRFIRSHADWDFVKVYTDEGISAVTTRHRDGFNEMIADALAGKIDLIITKSVSRFARNTVDSLTTIRKLKEHDCECFFEKENIYTFDGKGELLITIMSSLAQEESRSISENVTWGHRKRMADGKVTLAYSTFLGYDKGEDGNLVVNEKEARIVRLIYRKFMEGMAPIGICRMLDEMGILTPGGKTHWRESTILSILSNEKYKGDALLQKTFTVDFLTKKHKRNEGEVQQFYVSGNHEAIIPPEEFEQVQAELARRKRVGRAFSGNSVFASRLVCGDCGSYYSQKVWHSNDPYRKVIWRCNRKYGKGERCLTPTLSEDEIKALFVEAYNQLLADRESIIEDCETLAAMLEDTVALDAKIAAAQEEIDTVVELNKALICEHAVTGIPQEEFDQRAAAYDERFRKADARLNRLNAEKQDRIQRSTVVREFIEALRGQAGPIEVWNEQAWCLLVTQAKVYADGNVEFIFRGENSITVRAK